MMYTSLEIEFKSKLTKAQYEALLKKYGLEDKVFKQTNYYFDTPDHKLINNHIILRIREKSYNIKYEVLYPTGTKQFNIKTKEGIARVISFNSGFFHSGPMVYKLIDKRHVELVREQHPIIIISQY